MVKTKKFFEEYNWKVALLSFFVLSIGSVFIFAINSENVLNPNWGGFLSFVIPGLFGFSFLPILIVGGINKIKNVNKSSSNRN